jgi:radical SAM protein with 4Fe4S-binding SPASM domain
MIDFERLYKAYDDDGIYALQLEVGDVCFQACSYCYMNALPREKNRLSDEKIAEILVDSKNLGITAIEWLGGEPLLRDSIFKHMGYARDLGFRNNMWTGGLPLADKAIREKTADLCRHGLIAFHLSTLDPEIYERLHPGRSAEDMRTILDAIKSLLEYGYPANKLLNSVTFTGQQTASDMINTIEYFEENFGIETSVNVYHTYLRPGTDPGELEKFIPSKKEIAKVYRHWKKQADLDMLPMNCVNKQYCSATVAVLCDGGVTGCATIREKDPPNVYTDGRFCDIVERHRDYLIFKRLKDSENLPENCRTCKASDNCWGCRSRAFAAGEGIFGRDPRCFRTGDKNE